MSPFDRETSEGLAVRCREWSFLVRDEEATARLRALAGEMDERRERLAALRGERKRLLNEIDAVITRAREALLVSRSRLGLLYTADALREESRLCREEVQGAGDQDERRAFASRALTLAQFGEMVARS